MNDPDLAKVHSILLLLSTTAHRLDDKINPACMGWGESRTPEGWQVFTDEPAPGRFLDCDPLDVALCFRNIRQLLDEVYRQFGWQNLCGMPEGTSLGTLNPFVKALRVGLADEMASFGQKLKRIAASRTYQTTPLRTPDVIPAEVAAEVGDSTVDLATGLHEWGDAPRPTQPATPAQATAAPMRGRAYRLLTSWREILITLGYKNNQEDRKKVLRLNETYAGPIVPGKQGQQPCVMKQTLLDWWQTLEIRMQDEQNQAKGKTADGEAQHDFGKTGRAAPNIGGGVKQRRRDRKA